MADLARLALEVQDACNLSGVVRSWSSEIVELRRLLPNAGTDDINQHPVNRLWASKAHDLCRMGLSDCDRYAEAYWWCRHVAYGAEVSDEIKAVAKIP